jgi:hypothetical protein
MVSYDTRCIIAVKNIIKECKDTLKKAGYDFEFSVEPMTKEGSNRLEWKVRGNVQRQPALVEGEKDIDKRNWEKSCAEYGFEAEDRLRVFAVDSNEYLIVAINSRASKYPIEAIRLTDKARVSFKASTVRALLGKDIEQV